MPLPMPTLDRLQYGELVTDGIAELPALAPGWTDYNAHDPGITLVELLAWLTENDSYRLNRIPESAYRAFLRLAGAEPRAAQVAQTMLVFAAIQGAVDLASRTRVANDIGSVEFETTDLLHVSNARLAVIASGRDADLEVIPAPRATTWPPLGLSPRIDDALYLGFDAPLGDEGDEISLGIFTGREAADTATRERLLAETHQWHRDRPRWCDSRAAGGAQWDKHYSARTLWEFRAADGWRPLRDVVDETRALTLSGIVRFKSPKPSLHLVAPFGATGDAATRLIRCRLVQGGYDCPPLLTRVAPNVVRARHSAVVAPESFESSGSACQRLALKQSPVVPGSTEVTIEPPGGAPQAWKEVSSFEGCGPHARVYVLRPEAATIEFGDGRSGRVPDSDAAIRVAYSKGSGAGGNVASLRRTVPADARVVVTQGCDAFGGAEAETLGEAKARAARQLEKKTRAVTLADFETLALETPGVPVARVHAIADYHPRLGRIRVDGSVTVVVLPACPDRRPEPGEALCEAVRCYLDRRRLLTTELHVVGPCYSEISVTARLHATPHSNARDVARQAREALQRFFHPLRGGADGRGYPIGRAAYRSEVLAVLNGVPGVTHVADLSWRVGERDSSTCGSAEICPNGLLISGSHQISVDPGSACRD